MRLHTPTDPDEIRAVIRATMKEAGLTQKGLAQHLGYTEKHVSHVLQGKAGLSLPVLFRILDYTGLTLAIIPRPHRRIRNP